MCTLVLSRLNILWTVVWKTAGGKTVTLCSNFTGVGWGSYSGWQEKVCLLDIGSTLACFTLFFLYKNIFYKNIEAEICEILRIFEE